MKRDFKRALELASTCQHPEARWLHQVFAGHSVERIEEVRANLLLRKDDARALCFYAMLDEGDGREDEHALKESARLGYAFARACMANIKVGITGFDYALQASVGGDRDGFFTLAYSYEKGDGCTLNLEKAKRLYLAAARGNCVYAMENYALMLSEADLERWYWLGRSVRARQIRNFQGYFPILFPAQVKGFSSDPSLAPIVFSIGRALKGHVDTEEKEIFGRNDDFEARIGPANRALEFFSFQCAAARKAVDMWCLIARRYYSASANKDIRKKIGRLIWEARELANYLEPL